MNIISLGYQCSTALGLKAVGLRKVALPFDYLKSPLPSIIYVLNKLKSPDFNMQEFLKEFLSTKKGGDRNILGFWLGHFKNEGEWVWLEGESKYTKPTQEDILKYESMYRLNDEYCNIAHPEVYEIFERRFNRLKDMFFTQSNILVYNDIKVNSLTSSKWARYVPELMSLNNLNRLIYITYTDREVLLSLNDTVEIHRLDLKELTNVRELKGNKWKQKIHDKIKRIFTDVK